MIKRRWRRSQTQVFLKVVTVSVFLLLSYGAVRIGIAGGNYIYNNGFQIVEKIDVEKFKSILNSTLPLINVTYNSGSIGNPFTAQVKKLVRMFSGFDLNAPVTIMNTQAPYFYLYYKNNYLPLLALEDKIEKDEGIDPDSAAGREPRQDSRGNIDSNYDKGLEERKPGEKLNEDMPGNNSDNNGNEDSGKISFYYYEGEEEKLETPEESIINGQEIVIQNMTKYKIDVDALLKEPLNIKFNRSGPKILIFHTHTTESFIKKLDDLNKKDVPNWSLDPQESVVRVGHELAELLRKKYGYDVLHNGTVHDYPDYEKAYSNAYETLNNYLKSHPSIKLVFDIHRDGLSKDQSKLRLTTKIDGKDVAKIMFVVGTDARRPEHPNWKENLKLALKLQENLNKQHPGLARHIYISNNVYNQNLTTGSLIIEIGGDGNLLSECLESVKYLAKAIYEVIK
ncbi:MAG: stage II sporulation protein P [Firmicutes bacterium]|nr:stage II sporulation protein P [Bacillota bacterium]